jgi:peptidoglycan hydrolase-like protein with peptidoglycan-binding domain
MVFNLELQRFSASEFAMGGVALATVVLVTFVDLRTLQPADPLAAPPQSPLAQSRAEFTGPIDRPPGEPSEPSGLIRELQPPPPRIDDSTTANPSRVKEPTLRAEPTPAQIAEAASSLPDTGLNPQNPSDAIWVQARLADLGYFSGTRSGIWGPVSRSALRDFKSMNGLQEDDRWDRETEQRLASKQVIPAARTFIGAWAPDIDQCRTSAPIAISSSGAKALGAECDFRSVKREATARWRIQAVCADGGSSWNANVTLKLAAPKLVWSSERGTETYVRCVKPPISSASSLPGETPTTPLSRSLDLWLQGVKKLIFADDSL